MTLIMTAFACGVMMSLEKNTHVAIMYGISWVNGSSTHEVTLQSFRLCGVVSPLAPIHSVMLVYKLLSERI